MTLDDVIAKLAEIRNMANDDESAHAEQDELYVNVLTAIAEGDTGGDAGALAREALKVQDIRFSRWYA